MKNLTLSILILLLSLPVIFSQSTEDKEKPKKEKVITNQTLKELRGTISVIGKEEEIKEEVKEESGKEKTVEVKDEKYWRGLKKEIEDRIAQTSKKIETMKEELNILYRDFYSIDDPARREQIQVKIVETTRKIEEAEGELEKAKKELEEFMERARKEGALPGWLR